jgi:hypothetical protein
MTTDQKGSIAEWAIVLSALKLGVDVYRPVAEGGRTDLVLDLESKLWRVQCKWAECRRNVIPVRCYSSRRTRDGLTRRIYEPSEIDAMAVYCPTLDRCYFVPLEQFGRRSQIQLRVGPALNRQEAGINWAKDYEFAAKLTRDPGAIAQLGERRHGMAEVAGSIPAGSISSDPAGSYV